MKTDYECKKCGYKWKARVEKPTVCPRCKQYGYDEENGELNEQEIQNE